MPTDPLRMHWLTLRFADAQLEAAFAAEQAQKSLRPVRIGLAVLGWSSLSYYFLTIHLLPGVFVGIGASEQLRFSLAGASVCLLAWALTYRPIYLAREQTLLALLAGLLWVGLVVATGKVPAAVLDARGFAMPMWLTFMGYGVLRLRIVAASALGWLGTGLFIGYLVAHDLGTTAGWLRSATLLVGTNLCGMVICWQVEVAARREFIAMRGMGEERARAERLLLNILPAAIAERLKLSEASIAEHRDAVTVLFADIVGFTPLSATKSPQHLVDLLNRIFSGFDALADTHGLEKIKTIGDAYMAVAGLPQARADHAQTAARMALAMHAWLEQVAAETGEALALRIGLHSGPVVAGVIGRRKFAYDLWGDTVNTASRMESHGVAGGVHCSGQTAALLGTDFPLEPRGRIDIKGKGPMETFLLRPA